MRNRQSGFSLIELLIVVAIILIIAAIAIPNLLSSRMAANESSAVGSLRTMNTAQVTYASQCPQEGFASTFAMIGPGDGNCAGTGGTGTNLIDAQLTAGIKSGYGFGFTGLGTADFGNLGTIPGPPPVNTTYGTGGQPANLNRTGKRSFCTDDSGVIMAQAGALAPAANCPLPWAPIG